MKRRDFLLIGGVAGIAIGTGSYKLFQGESSDVLEMPGMLIYLFGKDEVELIGKEYLEKSDVSYSVEDLHSLLTENIDMEKLTSEEVSRELEKRIKSDFQNQNTVVIRGILLSRTEALQCSLNYKL
jgi:hypothetical protein